MDLLFSFTTAGLAYDVVGVSLLGWAFFSKTVKAMAEESKSGWDSNSRVLHSLARSRTDSIMGTLLLAWGFTLQWCGSLDMRNEEVVAWLWGLLLVGVLIYLVWLRQWLIGRQISQGESILRKDP